MYLSRHLKGLCLKNTTKLLKTLENVRCYTVKQYYSRKQCDKEV